MSAWLLYLLVISALLALTARVAEEIAALYRRPTRWIWALAIALSFLFPPVVSLLPDAPPPIARQTDLGNNVVPPRSPAWSSFEVAKEVSPLAALKNLRLPPGAERLLVMSCVMSSGVMLVIFVASYARLHRARRRWPAQRVCDVPVLLSRRAGPAVLGVLRPAIVLPQWVLSSTQDVQRMVIMHESEHLRARDHGVLAFGCLALALAPWNPALWWMLFRLRGAVEVDCDSRVLMRGTDARAYGAMLLGVARRASLLPFAVALRHPQSLVERRIRAMTRRLPRFRAGRTAVLTSLAALFLVAATRVDTPAFPATARAHSTSARAAEALDVPATKPYSEIGHNAVPSISPASSDQPPVTSQVAERRDAKVELSDVGPALALDHPRQQVLILPHDVARELRETGGVLLPAKNQRVRLAAGILIASSPGISGIVNISGKVANAKVVRSEQGARIVIDGVVTEPERIEPGQEPSPLVIVNGVIIGTTEAYLQGQVTAAELEAAEVIRSGKDFERFGRRIIWVTKQVEAPVGAEVKLLTPRLTVRPPADPSDTRQPLFVVDGVVVSRSANLQGISTADIESIEVIKGPQAIVRFGSEARDGVIFITTKQEKPSGLSASEMMKELTVRMTGPNAPLIVVDGVVINSPTELESEALKRLEIEAIEIIKGAAAEKLYGTRATYGVISIITKKGIVPR